MATASISTVNWHRQGTWLLLCAITLTVIGLVMVASASFDLADAKQNGNSLFFLQRHGSYLLIALLAALVAYQVPTSLWQRYGAVLLILSYVLLVVVMLPGVGKTVKGSTRWVSLGSFTLQVSEFAKIFVPVYLAGYLVRRQAEVQEKFWGFVKPVLLISLMALLLLMQPDFGAVVVLMLTVFVMLFLGGVRFAQFMLVVSSSLMAAVYLIRAENYRLERVTGYLNPWKDPLDKGYQLIQSLIAFGRGEISGLGLGNGIQKLFYLPEAHTDFLFAVWAEETGLIGSLVLIAIFMLLVFMAMKIARRAEKNQQLFSAYLGYGFAVLIGFQGFINMGVCSGLLPTKGLTLPLVSYGGTSLLVSAIIVAMLLRINKETSQLEKPLLAKGKEEQ